MLELVRPIARTAKLVKLKCEAELLVRLPTAVEHREDRALPPPAFVVGCGRSGTTLLGGMLERHAEITYLREPYHLWATVDPALDVTNLHVRTPPRLWWDSSDVSELMRVRFQRLILGARERAGRKLLVEKTPHNVYRIGLLDALTERRARFIHIVRDGVHVARSIAWLASTQPYRMAWRADYNQWWGANHLKWRRLEFEGPRREHFSSEEVACLTTPLQRAAYEWLTSLAEADRWRSALGDRFLEIRYVQLARDANDTLRGMALHLGATIDRSWLDAARAMITRERTHDGMDVRLPVRLAQQFNSYQERYGFSMRALAL